MSSVLITRLERNSDNVSSSLQATQLPRPCDMENILGVLALTNQLSGDSKGPTPINASCHPE